MKMPQFTIKITEGGFLWPHRVQLQLYHNLLKKLNGQYAMMTIEPVSEKRTIKQNSYYWGVYLPLISDQTGDDIHSLHEHFKNMFLKRDQEGTALGEKIELYKSTTELTTKEFTEFINQIEKRTGIPAPDSKLFQHI